MTDGRLLTKSHFDMQAFFTTREFVLMVDAGAFNDMTVELVRGRLTRLALPETLHARWQTLLLMRLLASFGETRMLGTAGIDLGRDTMVACDAVLLNVPVPENRRLIPADITLVVEIAISSITRDLGLKRSLYAEAGIPNYWVVDPEREVTHVYREPVAGEYRLISTVPFDRPLDVPGGDRAITLA